MLVGFMGQGGYCSFLRGANGDHNEDPPPEMADDFTGPAGSLEFKLLSWSRITGIVDRGGWGESRDPSDPTLRGVSARRKRTRRRVKSWGLVRLRKANGTDLGSGESHCGLTYAAITVTLLFVALGVWPLITLVGSPTSYTDDPVERAEERHRWKMNETHSLSRHSAAPHPYSLNPDHDAGLGLRHLR